MGLNDGRECRTFLALALGLSGLLGVLLAATGGPEGPGRNVLGFALMIVPAASAPATRARLEGLGWRLPLGWTLLGLVYPVAIFALGGLGALAALGHLRPAEPPDLRRLAASSAISLAILVPLALGEEIGWRGFLQPRFERLFGPRRGIVAVALVWALWHVPFAIQGYYQPDHPILGALVLAPIAHLGIGVFFGWLHLRTRSVLVVALSHAMLNHGTKLPFRLFEPRPEDDLAMFVSVGALLALGAAAILARGASSADRRQD